MTNKINELVSTEIPPNILKELTDIYTATKAQNIKLAAFLKECQTELARRRSLGENI